MIAYPRLQTEEHLKLLYLISRYSHTAQPGDAEKDRWIRKLPLLVLIYEGIVAKVFDYDYAPASEVLGTRRLYLCVACVSLFAEELAATSRRKDAMTSTTCVN